MNNEIIEAHELVVKARESLRRGDKLSAQQFGEQAARLAPEMEDVWLVLTAAESDPQEALAHARKALTLNPQSGRARQGVEWASGRLKQAELHREPSRGALKAPLPPKIVSNQVAVTSGIPKIQYQTAVAAPALNSNPRNWLLPALLAGAGCVVVGFLLFFALTSPVLASIVSPAAPTQENLWAPVDIAKPQVTPIDGSVVAVQIADTPTQASVVAPTLSENGNTTSTKPPLATSTPSQIPTEAPSTTPAATETPGVLAMEILADTPTSAYIPPTKSASNPPVASSGNGVRWIDVDLTNQMTYAYEGDTMVNSFVVSTGTWQTPTVTGRFKIYIRLASGDMRGPGYYLPDVPYIMYFYKSYGLHGTYWHSNFGTPMSHGCVNLSIPDAQWLYNWSHLGTEVNVHY